MARAAALYRAYFVKTRKRSTTRGVNLLVLALKSSKIESARRNAMTSKMRVVKRRVR